MILAVAALYAPLVGVTGTDHTAHRVDRGGLPIAEWETATHATATCGALVKLLEVRWADLRTRGTTIKRCPLCRNTR